ncbi:SDR family NAD(P)-dependent oxidoreductase [Kribbella sp. NPDC006257]|uniref:SDR family NAD(P)-dependent oxidoreductase n=1 Tax=Kribbella sp. NPDC006257 TaxID=3156738 RepID=UPI0033ABCC30
MTRTVVISGGGTGIGLATAEEFAADGDQVVLLGRREGVPAEAADGIPVATYFPADLRDPKAVRRAADFISERHKVVDVLIHSAGGRGT